MNVAMRLAFVVALVAALATGVVISDGAARAQTPNTRTLLITSLGERPANLWEGARRRARESVPVARKICTGSSAVTLKEVQAYFWSTAIPNFKNATPTAAVYSDWNNRPGSKLTTLTSPTAALVLADTSRADFTTDGYVLAPNTAYWVSFATKDPDPRSDQFQRIYIRLSYSAEPLGPAEPLDPKYRWSMGRTWNGGGELDSHLRMAVYGDTSTAGPAPPVFSDKCDGSSLRTSFTIKEGTAANTVVGKVRAVDPNGDPLTYTLSGSEEETFSKVFEFDATKGEIRVKDKKTVPEHEMRARYRVTINVSDREDAQGNPEATETVDAEGNTVVAPIIVDDQLHVGIHIRDVPPPYIPNFEGGQLIVSTQNPRVGETIWVRHSNQDWSNIYPAIKIWAVMSEEGSSGIVRRSSYRRNYTPTEADVGKRLQVEWLLLRDYSPLRFARIDFATPGGAGYRYSLAKSGRGQPGRRR